MSAAKKTEESQFKIVDISEIVIDIDKNPRGKNSYRDMQFASLAKSIKEEGIKEPVIVVEREDGYHVIAGFRRSTAASLIAKNNDGKFDVPIKIAEIDDKDIKKEIVIHQMMNKGFTLAERAKAVNTLSEEGMSADDISTTLGISKPTVQNLLSLQVFEEEYLEEIATEDANDGNIYALAKAVVSCSKGKGKLNTTVKNELLELGRKSSGASLNEFNQLIKKTRTDIVASDTKEESKINQKKSGGKIKKGMTGGLKVTGGKSVAEIKKATKEEQHKGTIIRLKKALAGELEMKSEDEIKKILQGLVDLGVEIPHIQWVLHKFFNYEEMPEMDGLDDLDDLNLEVADEEELSTILDDDDDMDFSL